MALSSMYAGSGIPGTMPYGNSSPYQMNNMPNMNGYAAYQEPQRADMAMSPHYASGGHVGPLMGMIQGMGQGGDTILAHINPQEAEHLQQNFGMDINPFTGLPQFGKFGRTLKKLLPILGSVIGTVVGGPAGGAIGGAIGGAARGSKDKKGLFRGKVFKEALRGGLTGAALGSGAHLLGGGSMASLGHSFGLGGLGGAGSALGGAGGFGSGITGGIGSGALSALQGAGLGGAGLGGAAGASGLGGALSGLTGALGGPLNTILAGTALTGLLAGKMKPGKQEPIQDIVNRNRVSWGPESQYRAVTPLTRRQINPDERIYSPNEMHFFEDVNPPTRYMSHGGYLDGSSDGQADTIDAKLSDGEYVIPSYAVSGLGSGNNNAGAKVLDKFVKNIAVHQRSKKTGLPPKSKKPDKYLPNLRGVA